MLFKATLTQTLLNICIINTFLIKLDDLKKAKLMFDEMKHLLEKSAFGVCSYLGEKLGIATTRVRLYFIYLSFAALGSPIIFYLFVAFWINIKDYIKQKRNTIWE
jgi:phage shock protein PspC (stress-responsive transcriptional regulator)